MDCVLRSLQQLLLTSGKEPFIHQTEIRYGFFKSVVKKE